ncbi:hypothetical protein GIB67_029627 [Kingdonia uniflora]|uniref:Uncharacterized protein n=1 Tax=Kingdonia uniflora TaxID=39325 RepID=A0A7J7LLP2_9MAGN|nr:hypothetical protein GIB67_029627 [Kingdonia uniflora]
MVISRLSSSLIKKISPSPLLPKLVRSSSSTSPRNPNFSSGDGDDDSCGSVAYKEKQLFGRPTKIDGKRCSCNRTSFIGSVVYPLKEMNAKSGKFGVYTELEVRFSRESGRSFRILLTMWNEIAGRAFEHLKQYDFIYVSGLLDLYTVPDASGKSGVIYKVNVFDLNYVKCPAKLQSDRKSELGLSFPAYNDPDLEDEKLNPLTLWTMLFRNPNEWWDNRGNKLYSKAPDFKNKDTGEALWISPEDPPWVKKHLQKLDSKRAQGEYGERGSRRVSMCNIDNRWFD